MQPTKELIDALYLDKVRQARAMSPEQRLSAGFDLFELTTSIMADGIRSQFPNANQQQVYAILRERLALIRRRENCK